MYFRKNSERNRQKIKLDLENAADYLAENELVINLKKRENRIDAVWISQTIIYEPTRAQAKQQWSKF